MGASGNAGNETQNAAESFTQDQVNAIVADRLAREREKYKDYNDLKNKAAEYDKAQEANYTELSRYCRKR